MDKYKDEKGQWIHTDVVEIDVFSNDIFNESVNPISDQEQVYFHSNLGSLTVVDRMTGYGYGIRDTETGYRDKDGNFWLASGMQDVRLSGAKTIGEAIEWVKSHANTCVPTLDEA